MVKEFKIDSLTTKTVNIQGEDKEVWVVNGKADSFKGKWNNHWAVGKTVKADVVEKGKYITLKCPPELKQNFSNPKLDEILEKTNKILKILEHDKPYGERSEFIPPPEQPNEEVSDEDIAPVDQPF